ncbi:MAG: type I glyceraldehyde-3-phosphate dehydrogenase, partial [Alkalimonas sp.]|nr:type I glyceraldehyde-3-phosphate dehydrogenase [Alkalimonas sp.]
GALNVVMGVNHQLYDHNKHRIVTAASCTTNCLAPVVKVIHQSLGIKHGSITTIHDLTNTQSIMDTPHKDLRRARACGTSLIPTTTGSATAIIEIFPELKGRLNGHAVRVPLTNASLTDCVFEVERATSAEEVNQLLKTAAEGELKDILGYEERPLVSIDYKTDPRSSIIDALSTMVINGTQVKIYAWYDNEWGYANRTVELAKMVGLSDQPGSQAGA